MATQKSKSVKIFLSSWQKRFIQDYLRIQCEFIELPILKGKIMMYMVCPNDLPKGPRLYLTDEQIKLMGILGKKMHYIELPKDSDTILMYGVPTKGRDK